MKRLLVLVAVVAVSVAACGGGTATDQAPKKLRFALIPKSLDIPVFNYANAGAQRTGKELGVEVI